MALYLKYRPQTFGDVVGQEHITSILQAQAKAGGFSHNYLLFGPRGTGKTTTARLLAKAVNAAVDADGNLDLENDPLVELITSEQTLDYVEIDAASHTGVDNVREEIIEKAIYPPSQLKKKVYVIDEVHMLSKAAFNALLKIMEEPPEYLMFVLATTEINKVPDTIISRCQVFNFKHITTTDIVGRLEYIAKSEEITYEELGLQLIAKLANGALRDAIKYLEQVSMLGDVTAENVTSYLGVVAESALQQFAEHLQSKDFGAIVGYVSELAQGGTDLMVLAKDMLGYIDERFLDDPAGYTEMTQLFHSIVQVVKNSAHPLVMYKAELWKYCSGEVVSAPSKQTKQPTAAPKAAPKKPEPAAKEAPAVAPGAVEEAPAPVIEPAAESTEKAPPQMDFEVSEAQTVLQRIAEEVDKTMIKSILKKNAVADTRDGSKLEVIVINEQFYTMITKPDSVEYVQSIGERVMGSPIQLNFSYMSKEDYLAKQLEG